ncbi:hypothetical protein GGX14DRAFT_464568 [Mycena pura]|uniref:Ricin B lectin domain-containing protein n=1 Tax=Mycena pura TaxID=153505 RepID=A0AAD6V7E9_9AGAR|nr:hypothetical protein GGX14DRAFT_464568 [Mycena pura]
MLVSTLFTLLAVGITTAAPLDRRDVALDAAATAEAQQRDGTATRAFTATTITTSDGRCLSVDPFSGDFRENDTPVLAARCDGSKNQTWDVITAGVHNNVEGQALIVSSLTNACLNFDNRRAVGDQVNLFSCGGRADGAGQVTDSQLFAFADNESNAPIALTPRVGKNVVCLTINGNSRLDQTACTGASSASGLELFTFGAAAPAATAPAATAAAQAAETTEASAATTAAADCAATTVTKTVTVTVTADSGKNTQVANVQTDTTTATAADAAITTTAAAAAAAATTAATGTAPVKVSGAGGVLNPTAVAEAQKKDNTATFAATGVTIQDSAGQCLSVDATGGDFRENLIPVLLSACDGSEGQKFDFLTKGVHNDQPGSALIVSSLVQNAQLFQFTNANLTAPYVLSPESSNGKVCFIDDNGRLVNTPCDATNPTANELFTIVA